MMSFESGARRLRTEPPLSCHDPTKPLDYASNAWLEYLGKRDLGVYLWYLIGLSK